MRAALMALGALSTSRRVHPAADMVLCLRVIHKKLRLICDYISVLSGYLTKQVAASLKHLGRCTANHPACVADALCDDACDSFLRCWPGPVGSLGCADWSDDGASAPRAGPPAELCAVLKVLSARRGGSPMMRPSGNEGSCVHVQVWVLDDA